MPSFDESALHPDCALESRMDPSFESTGTSIWVGRGEFEVLKGNGHI